MSAARADLFAAAAAGLVGAPFRLHGRDPVTGVDCVGLIAAALTRCGLTPVVPEGYALRALSVAPLLRFATHNGFVPLAPEAHFSRGDVVLFRLHSVQAHLGVVLGRGAVVHAHAGLGRVVIERRAPVWPIVGRWRLQSEGE